MNYKLYLLVSLFTCNNNPGDHFSVFTVQHTEYFMIQLNADSLYPFACWSLWLLCLPILMLIILRLILIESSSMLILYWLGDRKLIYAYLTNNSIQNSNYNLPKEFVKFKLMYWKYSMCLYKGSFNKYVDNVSLIYIFLGKK